MDEEKILLEKAKYLINKVCGKMTIADIQQEIMESVNNQNILALHHVWEQDIKGKGHYYVVWLLDENDRRQKQAKKKNRIELEKLIIEHYKKVHALQTVKDLYYEFLQYKTSLVKPNTIMRYRSDWENYYSRDREFIYKPIRSLKRTDIDLFFGNIVKTHDLNTKAFGSICSLLRQMLLYAMDKEYITQTPFRVKRELKKQCIPVRRKADRQETYTDEEIKLVCDEMERRYNDAPNNTAPLGVMLAFELGVRIGELMALHLSDVDFEERMVFIHSQLTADYDMADLDNIHRAGYKVVDYTKTPNSERVLPLTDRAVELLNRVLAANKQYGYEADGYIFLNANGIQPPKAVEAQLRSGCNRIGIKYRSPHKIRKSYASTLFNNGVPITTIQKLLGHSEPSTTLRYYTFDNTNKSEVYENVKNILNNRFEG